MTVSREQALANARASKSNIPRFCAQWTRTMFGVSALGDWDGDGAADAEDMWKAAKHRHPGDRNPPDGVPLYYLGGSSDNGHIGVADGGQLRGTDALGPGKPGLTPLNMPEVKWGHRYAGWSEDLYGHVIPSEAQARLAERIAQWAAKRRILKARLARARARRKEMK